MDSAPMVRRTDKSLSVILGGTYSRQLAHTWVDGAPAGWVISVTQEHRTLGQSDKFWTICSMLAKSDVTWDGDRQDKQSWHDLLMHGWMIATGKPVRLKQGLEGGLVSVGLSTKRLTKTEMIELLDYAVAWAAAHGIEMKE